MAGTSGISANANGTAAALLTYMAAGTATTLATPFKVAFLSAVRTSNSGTDTEWASGGSYVATAGGTTGGQPGPTWNAATSGTTGAAITNSTPVTQTGCPATTWAGNRIQDSTVTTNREIWYAPLTGGNKTVNSGDTCTIPASSFTLNLG
jgi:hypothetical protein